MNQTCNRYRGPNHAAIRPSSRSPIRYSAALLALIVPMLHSARADAAYCSSITDTGCWYDYSGVNFSLAAVGNGAVFGVPCPSPTNCGEFVNVFSADGDRSSGLQTQPNLNSPDPLVNPFLDNAIRQLAVHHPEGHEPGPTTLWALRDDGNLYKSTGDTRARDMNDWFQPWEFVASPNDDMGQPFSLRMIAHASLDPWEVIFGVDYDGNGYAYYPLEGNWQPSFLPGLVSTVYSDTRENVVWLLGDSDQGRQLRISWFDDQFVPPELGAPQPPPIPDAVELAEAAYGFDVSGVTQPMSVGREDAWLMTTDPDTTQFILRSTLSASGWSDWAPYDTGTYRYEAAGLGDFPPWSIVDARRLRGLRGELLLIGDNYHLLRYIPGAELIALAADANGAPLPSDPTQSTSGETAWIVPGTGYQPIVATSTSLAGLDALGDRLSVDVRLPELARVPGWLGGVNLTIDAPSVGIDNQWLGYSAFTAASLGNWETVHFPIDFELVETLVSADADVTFRIELNLPGEASGTLIDFLRFSGNMTDNTQFCGDGVAGPGEACDDGNSVGGDGCAPDCTLEEQGCSEANAIDLGPSHTVSTVAADACLKVTAYPGSWATAVVLQAQAGGSYPLAVSWDNCARSGTSSIAAAWQQVSLSSLSTSCATLIQLGGSSGSQATLKWWGNGG
jgi:cysteine-rich repeat protein